MNMQFLRAVCIGKVALQIFHVSGCGRIIGVFQHGWYLEAGNRVVLLHDCANGEIPFGVGVKEFEKYFTCRKLLEESEFFWEQTFLVFPAEGLTIDLQTAVSADGGREFCKSGIRDIRATAEKCVRKTEHGYLRMLLDSVEEIVQGKACTVVIEKNPLEWYHRHSEKKMEDFFRAVYMNDEEKINESLEHIIGLGIGLTPSMDDWLVGFLYVALRVPVCESKRGIIQLVCKYVLFLAPLKTNKISAAYLTAAAEGQYFEVLHEVVSTGSEGSINTLLCIGNSSGTDMLVGMIFAMEYCFFVEECSEEKTCLQCITIPWNKGER